MTTQYSVKFVLSGAAQSALKAIEGVRGSLQRLSQAAMSSNMTLQAARMGRAFSSVRTELRTLAGETTGLAVKFAGLGAAGAGALAFLLGPASEMENLQVRLEGLMGSSVKAQQALKMLQKFAVESPYSFTALADAMNVLKGQGIDPLGKDYKNIMSYLGSRVPDQERASNAVLAISQAWGLAKLQMGDVRQLIQAGVPVWDLLSSVTGKNTAQLQQMSSAGQLTRDVMSKMFNLMGKEAAGQGAKIGSLYSTIVSNIGDAWKLFDTQMVNTSVGGTSLFGEVKNDLAGVMKFLQTGLNGNKASQLAQTLLDIYKASKSLVFDGLIPVATEVAKLVSTLTALVGGPANALRLILGIMAAPLLASIFQATVAVANFGLAFSGVLAADGAITAIGASFIALAGGPVAATVAAIAGIGGAAALIYANWNGVSKWLFGFWTKYGALIKIAFFPLGVGIDLISTLYQVAKSCFDYLLPILQKCADAIGKGIVSGLKSVGNTINWLADQANKAGFFNRNIFTSPFTNRTYSEDFAFEKIRHVGNYSTTRSSASNFLPLPMRAAAPLKGQPQQKDKLAINLQIDSAGRPRVKEFSYQGKKDVDFRANMGMMMPSFV